MSENSARPARYVVPQGTYTPKPAYRRPGSDHSHIPDSLTRLVAEVKAKRGGA